MPDYKAIIPEERKQLPMSERQYRAYARLADAVGCECEDWKDARGKKIPVESGLLHLAEHAESLRRTS